MKAGLKFTAALTMLVALASFTGCQKSDLEMMTGSYTYKTSGLVGLVKTSDIGSTQPVDTVWAALTAEQGQLNIVCKDRETSTLILTWNDLAGDACSTQAHLDGRNIELAPNVKSASLSEGLLSSGEGIVEYSGNGTLYDNMLIIPMTYRGEFQYKSNSMTVVASKVECIAKAN